MVYNAVENNLVQPRITKYTIKKCMTDSSGYIQKMELIIKRIKFQL